MSDYWKKRFELLEEAQNQKGVEFMEDIERIYNRAIKETTQEIESWYARFANNEGITLTEAKRLLNSRELKEFRMSVEEYIGKGKTLGISDAWAKELERASVKVHVSRLEALKVQMQQQVESLTAYKADEIDKLMKDIYTDSYYKTAFEVQKGIKVGWEVHRLDTDAVNKTLAKPWAADGSNFSQRIWGKHRPELVKRLHDELTINLAQGKDVKKLVNKIAEEFGIDKNKAARLVYTEKAYFQSLAQKDSFEKLGVEEFEVCATLDNRTSPTCREMDGKHFPMKDFQVGVTAPPFHCYCRTATCPYFDDEFTINETRAARDSKGEYYKVPADMNYKEWKEAFVDGDRKGFLMLKQDGFKVFRRLPNVTVALKDKILKIQEAINLSGGVIKEEHIMEAGKAVQGELIEARADLKSELDAAEKAFNESALKKELDEVEAKKEELFKKYRHMDRTDPEYKRIEEEFIKARRRALEISNSDEYSKMKNRIKLAQSAYDGKWDKNAAELKSKLGEFRTMGIGDHKMNKEHYSNRGTLRGIVTEAYDHYPAEWVDASIKKGKLEITKVQRGFYNGRKIAISGWSKSNQLETAFHELGHRFEDVIEGIYEAEDAFYKRRTKDCELEWLGYPYAKSEKTRKDDFIHPYMGKEYPDNFYELVSMGFERAYMNPTELWQDEDFAQFIYGILALY